MPEEIVRVTPEVDARGFFDAGNLSFQHLDWASPYSRFDQPGCLALRAEGELEALISVEPENPPAAWVRFFVCLRDGRHGYYFSQLLQASLPYLRSQGVSEIYTLSLYTWAASLFEANGFSVDTHIITLARELESLSAPPDMPDEVEIRWMTARDLEEVQALDSQAFPPAWQMNSQSLRIAYQESAFSVVAVSARKVLGYLIATSTFSMAHLARLAVAPEAQHQHLGHALVHSFLEDCINKGINAVTVNTQLDNLGSLKLYQSMGFRQEGKLIPVYRMKY